jgi:hypothetical protein
VASEEDLVGSEHNSLVLPTVVWYKELFEVLEKLRAAAPRLPGRRSIKHHAMV